MTEQESLQIIQQMIATAKKEQKDDGRGWILWGWMLFLAALFTFINLYTRWVNTFFFWNVFGLASLALLGFQVVRRIEGRNRPMVKTYTQELFKKLNTGFFISLLLIILSMNLGVDPHKGFALLLGLYGFWMLIYGTVLDFRPSLIGAYLTWAAAFASLFITGFQWTMLLHAGAVLCGYIIPGHLANNEFNKIHPKASRV